MWAVAHRAGARSAERTAAPARCPQGVCLWFYFEDWCSLHGYFGELAGWKGARRGGSAGAVILKDICSTCGSLRLCYNLSCLTCILQEVNHASNPPDFIRD